MTAYRPIVSGGKTNLVEYPRSLQIKKLPFNNDFNLVLEVYESQLGFNGEQRRDTHKAEARAYTLSLTGDSQKLDEYLTRAGESPENKKRDHVAFVGNVMPGPDMQRELLQLMAKLDRNNNRQPQNRLGMVSDIMESIAADQEQMHSFEAREAAKKKTVPTR